MDQFFSSLRGQEGLNILDFAGASQANITFITELGHRISSEDFVRSMELAFGSGPDFYENQSDPERAERFLNESLNFPPEHFDGVMIWDALQFLHPSLLQPTVDKLFEILRPNSLMLAFFIADVWSDQLHCRNSSHRPVGSEARVLRFRFGNQNNAVSKDSCSRRL